MPAKKKVAITVRLEPKLARRIKKLAERADRSASSMIAWILEDRIADEERIVDGILRGLEDMRAGRYVEFEEFVEQMEQVIESKSPTRRNRKRSA